MKRLLKFTLAAVVASLIVACTTSPTGRSQLNLFSGSALNSLGAQSFAEIKQQERVSDDRELNAYAQCLADAIVAVLPEQFQGREWEVAVFESDTVNAFALPGGYMGFYTGIMRVAENEHQLAAVMGHEVGHVIADHSSERLSTNLLISGALIGADIAFSDRTPQQRAMIMAGLGLGAQIGVMLPYSRTHESEADEIGMDLMARAGFDPREAPKLWENMSRDAGSSPPELLSTHPSPQTRIRALTRQLPEVMPLYEARLASHGPANCSRPAKLDRPSGS